MAKQIERSVAVVTIKDAGRMTKKGRKAIADWLRKHADDLEKLGDNYAPRFRGRYLYRTGA